MPALDDLAAAGDPSRFDREAAADPSAAQAGKPSYRSLQQAAEWYATLRGEIVGDDERRAWQAWLAASPEHGAAWQHIEAVSRRFEPLRDGGHAAAVAGTTAARLRSRRRRQALNGIAGLGALALAGWSAWRHTALPALMAAWTAEHRTGTGEQRELRLADGTRVWLNTDSALDVAYDDTARELVLRTGELLVQTARDERGRPFFVRTRHGRLQALGTRFAVRVHDADARLDVFDGLVEIRLAAGDSRRLRAGEHARFDAGRIAPTGAADRSREAWTRGVVLADDIPLRALIDELARYRHGYVSVAPAIAGLRVMGVYPAHDPDRALAMLEANLPIRVRHTLPWWISVEPR